MGNGIKLGMTALLLACTCLSASSAEVAILQNGFSIRHQRHEMRGAVVRLHFAAPSSGYAEVPADQIVRFEAEETPPAAVLSPPPPPTFDQLVTTASSKNDVDPDLIMALIAAESGFNSNAISPKGAKGLMQLMPQTAARLGVENPMDPVANVQAGTRYLRELLDRYHNDLTTALAAYNAGPERVEQYRGVPPYPETRSYIIKVMSDLNRKKRAQVLAVPEQARKPGAVRNSSSVVIETAAHRSRVQRRRSSE
jgi:soluble lytic murein transglycosylase-like protein